MSDQWNGSHFQQGLPSAAGQVKMFDPTQFQTPSALGRAPTLPSHQAQNAGGPPPQQAPSSWDSWSSWVWNPDSSNPQGGDKQDQHGQETSSAVSQNQQTISSNVADNGYYGGDQYTGICNQGWEGTDQYSQPQTHTQPDANVHYDQSHQQWPVNDFQQYGEASFGQEQNHNNDLSNQQNQSFSGPFYDHHQQTGDQGQIYNQYQDQAEPGTTDLNSQHQQNQSNQQTFSAHYYNHLQPQAEVQGQVYNQYEGHEQYQDQAQSYYDQPYDASVWAATNEQVQWPGEYKEQQEFSDPAKTGSVITDEQILNESQNTNTESIPQTTRSPSTSHNKALTSPSLKICGNDDDGTVSGFFGRDGDSDGDVQLDAQRHNQSGGNFGSKTSSGVNQFLTVAPLLNRTNSEISNASLSTLNMSIGEDDDGQEPLHNIQELVKRMEEVDIARRQSEETKGNVSNSLTGEGVSVEHHGKNASVGVNEDVLIQKHTRGDYSGFGNDTYSHNALPSSLPFDKSARPSSSDGDQPGSSGSAESRVSDGSSGLTDWEIVSPQTGAPTNNPESSLDNNVTFFSDKPDGDMNVASDIRNLDYVGKTPQNSQNLLSSSTSDNNSNTVFQSPDHSKTISHHSTSAIPVSEPQSDTRGRSGSPFVAAFTDHRHGEPSPQIPSKISSSSPKTNSSVPSLEDGITNTSKRQDVVSAKSTNILQSTNQIPFSSSLLSALPDVRPAENTPATGTHQGCDTQRSQGLAALPSKHKTSPNSLTEDGNCISIRNSDQKVKSANTSSVQQRQPEEPPVRSSSRNSEVGVTGQQRHHSAFHPVSRSRHTTMSPATTLWDTAEAPAPNILLAPAMPLIIPNLNTYTASTVSTGSETLRKTGDSIESTVDKSKLTAQSAKIASSIENRDREKRDELNKSKERKGRGNKNQSYDSLDEIDAVVERQQDRYLYSQPGDSREPSYSHDYRQESSRRDPDRPVSRSDRPSSRSGQYHYDRALNRNEGYSRDDIYRRHRGSYRDLGDTSYDENYDRPRSRQDESHDSRPSSRSTQEIERSRSRTNYDRDREYFYKDHSRDETHSSRPSSRSAQEVDRPRSRTNYDRDRDYYYRDRNRSYGYDNYGRNVDYYSDEHERYYRYYREKEARYTRGYYEEYYGAKNAEYYYQQQQLQQEGRRQSSQESEQSSSRSQSRGSTPATAPSPGIPPAPGTNPSSGPDYYGNRGPHPLTRPDYNRDYYSRGYPYEGYNAYYDGYGYDPYAYGYSYPTYDEYTQGHNQGRLTPPKYSLPHVRASFGPAGQLVKVLPNRPADGQPATVEVQDIQTVLECCPEAEDIKHFPGPLTRAHTHKKDVLLFCQQKARACADDINMVDRESAKLIWRFLELLIKQNGSVVGTDLSDLLLEGHEPSTHEYSIHGVKISQSPEALDAVPEGTSEDSSSARASPASRVTSDKTVISSADKEREKWIDRFRNLLLYGHKKDALECAMKNNLWGHALFLASKMDARTHANVMTRFANGAIRMNDPLQTLYQLMSGRQPAAVTCVLDERWGDWRPHLAMILSNQTARQDIDRKSITTLGDTLATKGCLHASHFCYMMAQVNFGSYSKKTSKIVLIGSSHSLPLEEFATNEAIQCTEVFEYAQNLGNPSFCLTHFQIFKYLYACRLADYGMALEALQYCEVIAYNILQYPTWFQSPFVRLVFQLSSKLKFSDPQRQMSSEDAEDPMWLQQLDKICASYRDGSIQPLSGTATPAGFPGTTTSSESGDYNTFGIGYVADAAATSTVSSTSDPVTYGHQQQHTQVDNNDYSSNQDSLANTDQQEQQQVDYNYSLWQQQYGHYNNYGEQQQQMVEQTADHQQCIQHQQVSQLQETSAASSVNTAAVIGYTSSSYTPGSDTYTDNMSYHGAIPTQLGPQLYSQEYGSYDAGRDKQAHRGSISTNEAYEDDDNDDDNDEDVMDGPSQGFDYFGNVGPQKVVAPPHRYRHMSGSSTGSTRRRRTMSNSSTGSVKVAPHKPPSQQQDGGRGLDKVPKPGQPDNGGSGWFGGLFNKFKVKGKNEMILPDDKNPSIVWDPVKKKWTNADGTEEEDTPAAPPPKDTDLIGKASSIPSATSGPPPVSNISGANRFSLKAKGARNQYVDVTNPRSVSVPQNLFNVLPVATINTSSTAGPKMFVPGSGQPTDSSVTDVNNSNATNSLLTVPHSDDDKPITDHSDTTDSSAAAPGMPMLFNPTSLKGNSVGTGQASSSTGPGLKVGQRRKYPK